MTTVRSRWARPRWPTVSGWSGPTNSTRPSKPPQVLLRPGVRFTPEQRVNGVFAMTPDNLPFVGRHPDVDNVWVAQALWVTHAAGAATMLADAMTGERELPSELGVARFDRTEPAALRERALRLYRDIYANDGGPGPPSHGPGGEG